MAIGDRRIVPGRNVQWWLNERFWNPHPRGFFCTLPCDKLSQVISCNYWSYSVPSDGMEKDREGAIQVRRSASRTEFDRPVDTAIVELSGWLVDTAKTLSDARDSPADVMPILISFLKQSKLWLTLALKRLEGDSVNKNLIAAVDYSGLVMGSIFAFSAHRFSFSRVCFQFFSNTQMQFDPWHHLESFQKCLDIIDVTPWPKGGKWDLLRYHDHIFLLLFH